MNDLNELKKQQEAILAERKQIIDRLNEIDKVIQEMKALVPAPKRGRKPKAEATVLAQADSGEQTQVNEL
jgi:hypothetical protein